jgi:hypothetical protein
MRKGAMAYAEKLEQLRQLNETHSELQLGLSTVNGDIERYEELKEAIAQVQRALLEEQLKAKALMEEVDKPINIHRWRQLQDTNSDAYNRLRRVRLLQKDLIHKTDEVEDKDKLIQEKEKLYVELKRVVARQPGPEAAEQLRLYASTLRDKKNKFKAIKGELKIYQAKVYDLKYEISKQSQDMRLVKLSYFEKRRRETRGDFGDVNMRPDSASTDTTYGAGKRM